jgi:hypothetical protein
MSRRLSAHRPRFFYVATERLIRKLLDVVAFWPQRRGQGS